MFIAYLLPYLPAYLSTCYPFAYLLVCLFVYLALLTCLTHLLFFCMCYVVYRELLYLLTWLSAYLLSFLLPCLLMMSIGACLPGHILTCFPCCIFFDVHKYIFPFVLVFIHFHSLFSKSTLHISLFLLYILIYCFVLICFVLSDVLLTPEEKINTSEVGLSK